MRLKSGKFWFPRITLYEELNDPNRDHVTDLLRSVSVWVILAINITFLLQRILKLPTEISASTDGYIVNLLQIAVPLYFYGAGRAVPFCSNCTKTSLRGKILNIGLPLIVGYYTLAALTAFIGREYLLSAAMGSVGSGSWRFLGACILETIHFSSGTSRRTWKYYETSREKRRKCPILKRDLNCQKGTLSTHFLSL